jgi:hypothetical protein
MVSKSGLHSSTPDETFGGLRKKESEDKWGRDNQLKKKKCSSMKKKKTIKEKD